MRKLVLLVPLIYILPHFFEDKVFAVFLAEPVSDFFSVLTATILFFATMRGMLWGKKKERSQQA